MNGRPFNLGQSNSQKNMIFNNIKYVKPMYFINQGQQESRNLYYDSNPYFLNHNPLNSRGKGIYNTSRNSQNSRDISDTSSQRSGKVVRANGLRLAQKPRIMKGGVQQRQPRLSQSRNNEQTRKLFDRSIELQNQNRMLKEQNQRLRQNMQKIEDSHRRQISLLNSRFQSLIQKAQQIQRRVEQEEYEWKKRFQQFSHLKNSTNSQINEYSVSTGSTPVASSNIYYNGSINYNGGNSHIKN